MVLAVEAAPPILARSVLGEQREHVLRLVAVGTALTRASDAGEVRPRSVLGGVGEYRPRMRGQWHPWRRVPVLDSGVEGSELGGTAVKDEADGGPTSWPVQRSV